MTEKKQIEDLKVDTTCWTRDGRKLKVLEQRNRKTLVEIEFEQSKTIVYGSYEIFLIDPFKNETKEEQ